MIRSSLSALLYIGCAVHCHTKEEGSEMWLRSTSIPDSNHSTTQAAGGTCARTFPRGLSLATVHIACTCGGDATLLWSNATIGGATSGTRSPTPTG